MTGLTLRELCAALTDELAIYAPAPPPAHMIALIEAADQFMPDPELEPDPQEDSDFEPECG